MRIFCTAKDSHIFQKNAFDNVDSVYLILSVIFVKICFIDVAMCNLVQDVETIRSQCSNRSFPGIPQISVMISSCC